MRLTHVEEINQPLPYIVRGACQTTRVPFSQLRGQTFAFGDERSTIGRYLSQLLLVQHGIRADELLSYEYLGRHDRVGTAVGAGQFDAGALKESTFRKLKKKGGENS